MALQRPLEIVNKDELLALKRPVPASRWTSALVMGVAIFSFIYEALAYNLIFLGRILPAVGKQALVVPFAVLFNSVWFLAIWSYVMAHLCNPGIVPERWHEFVRETHTGLEVVPARAEWQPAQVTFCRKCLATRPERAHHCVICHVCVLRMDHHCPWINNCVGFNNHKFFLLLGIYTEIACLVALLSCIPELVACTMSIADSGTRFTWLPDALQLSDVAVFLAFGIVTAMVCGLLTQMMVIHAGLAVKNTTSIEDQYRNMSNPFDLGSTALNLAQIFGALGPDWAIPIKPLRPISDGIIFPTNDEGGENLAFMGEVTEEGLANPWKEQDGVGVQEVPESLEEAETRQMWRLRYNIRAPNVGTPEEPRNWIVDRLLPRFFSCNGGGSNSRRFRELQRRMPCSN